MSGAAADGRRQRGERSREAILAAASAVIVETGVAGLTYREVADRAGVSLARVSYHFPSVDELLVAATTQYLDEFDARLADLAAVTLAQGGDVVDACTEFLRDLVGPGAPDFLAMVEIRLALHRRGATRDSDHVLGVLTSYGLTDEVAVSVLSSLFGFAVLAATASTPLDRETLRSHVAAVLAGNGIVVPPGVRPTVASAVASPPDGAGHRATHRPASTTRPARPHPRENLT